MPVRCENFEKVGAEIRPLGPKKLSHFFSSVFGVIFTQPNLFVHSMVCFVVSLYLLGSVNIMGDVHGSCSECDVPVPGIPGTGNFQFFWWYRNRYRNKLVPEKSLGTGIGQIWYR